LSFKTSTTDFSKKVFQSGKPIRYDRHSCDISDLITENKSCEALQATRFQFEEASGFALKKKFSVSSRSKTILETVHCKNLNLAISRKSTKLET